MTEIIDLIGKVIVIMASAIPVLLLFRKSRLDRRATEVEVQTDLLDEFNKQADRAVVEAEKLRTANEVIYHQLNEIRQLKIDKERDGDDNARATAEIARLQQVNADQAKTIDKLAVSVDGMPTVIAQLMRQTLSDNTFKELLQQTLVEAGVATKDQPIEPPKETLKKLDLSAAEAVEKAQGNPVAGDPTALHSGDTVTVTVAPPETPET